ncbi:hypothetical protein SOPP22_17295 [Shewanella sp. OPT22]|nr:hypothetical protein SOPP22_17295 [Shewanella sp. OPT22]
MLKSVSEVGKSKLISILSTLNLKQISFDNGEYILRKGEKHNYFYWEQNNDTDISIQYLSENGRSLILPATKEQNRLYGEVEVLVDEENWFDVIATKPLTLKIVPVQTLLELMQEHSEIALWYCYVMTVRYKEIIDTSFSYILNPLSFNVASDILHRHQTGASICHFEKQVDEAARFGCSERVYRRVIKEFVVGGILQKTQSGYELLDAEKLVNLVDGSH